MPARRSLLTAIAGTTATVLTGCLDTDGSQPNQSSQSTPTEQATGTATATSLPALEDCSDRYRPTVRAPDTGVDPLPYPDLPTDLEEGSAKTFATAFERAWWHNEVRHDRPEVGRITVDVSTVSVTTHESGTGFVVETSGTVGFTYTATPQSGTPTAEPTEVAGTSGRVRSRYLVTERFARRAEDTNASPVPPAEGTLVACVE
ncbi:hypothetical protein [Halomarina oriensis]|uniref:Uncharacterized protein n=1 Tax=Halomarina oriensis TaxID=671145 RepID=A0A6B0GT32_9EURY|nr:hypothetical protein [Halomarina oriensis]MWG35833.1 hypothetical protein [Halomarina oriensis]